MRLLACLTLALIFSACSDGDPKCHAVDCTLLTESECLSESLCTAFYGNKIDESAMCFGPSEMIVCGNAETAQCNNSIVGYVIDPNGTCWYQSAACFGTIPGYETGSDFTASDCPDVSEPCDL